MIQWFWTEHSSQHLSQLLCYLFGKSLFVCPPHQSIGSTMAVARAVSQPHSVPGAQHVPGPQKGLTGCEQINSFTKFWVLLQILGI